MCKLKDKKKPSFIIFLYEYFSKSWIWFLYFSLAKFIKLLKSVDVVLIDFHWNGVWCQIYKMLERSCESLNRDSLEITRTIPLIHIPPTPHICIEYSVGKACSILHTHFPRNGINLAKINYNIFHHLQYFLFKTNYLIFLLLFKLFLYYLGNSALPGNLNYFTIELSYILYF